LALSHRDQVSLSFSPPGPQLRYPGEGDPISWSPPLRHPDIHKEPFTISCPAFFFFLWLRPFFLAQDITLFRKGFFPLEPEVALVWGFPPLGRLFSHFSLFFLMASSLLSRIRLPTSVPGSFLPPPRSLEFRNLLRVRTDFSNHTRVFSSCFLF